MSKNDYFQEVIKICLFEINNKMETRVDVSSFLIAWCFNFLNKLYNVDVILRDNIGKRG